jgi:uncharacterized protein YneF (UPF0154 family)
MKSEIFIMTGLTLLLFLLYFSWLGLIYFIMGYFTASSYFNEYMKKVKNNG